MSNYTLVNSQQTQGWVSFYSFFPDYIIGMNNFLYTFKGGNLYKHNSSEVRNTFYLDWWTRMGSPESAFVPSSIQSVINQAVLDNKIFKTIALQGDSIWDMQLETDLQNSGYIDAVWFSKKESAYFAFVRNNDSGQLSLRSINGIGNSVSAVDPDTATTKINFSINPLVSIGDIVSVGDFLYFDTPAPLFAGQVVAINVNYPAGINQLVIDNTMATPPSNSVPTTPAFYLYIKNSVAESHGVLGHYCKFTMENSSVDKIELFAVESDVMKSFP